MGTINEARARLLLPPVEGGDAHHVVDPTAIHIGCGVFLACIGLASVLLGLAAYHSV